MPIQRTLLFLGLCALPGFLVGTAVYAFVLLGASWPQSSATYRANPNFPVEAGTEEDQVEAIRCAADAWRNQGQSDFRFNFGGTTTSTTLNSADGQNIVFPS